MDPLIKRVDRMPECHFPGERCPFYAQCQLLSCEEVEKIGAGVYNRAFAVRDAREQPMIGERAEESDDA